MLKLLGFGKVRMQELVRPTGNNVNDGWYGEPPSGKPVESGKQVSKA